MKGMLVLTACLRCSGFLMIVMMGCDKLWICCVQAILSPVAESPKPEPEASKLAKAPEKISGADKFRHEGRAGTAPSGRAPAAGFVEQMPDMTLSQCCTSLNFWLLFLTCSIGEPSLPPHAWDDAYVCRQDMITAAEWVTTYVPQMNIVNASGCLWYLLHQLRHDMHLSVCVFECACMCECACVLAFLS